MIKNELQYKITKEWVGKFKEALESYKIIESDPSKYVEWGDVHPRLIQASRDAVQSKLSDLEKEVYEYEQSHGKKEST